MMKHEFESLIGEEIGIGDFELVELVYNYHPAIKNIGGKEQVMNLYKGFGLVIFRDMEGRAQNMAVLDAQEQNLRAQLNQIHVDKKALK